MNKHRLINYINKKFLAIFRRMTGKFTILNLLNSVIVSMQISILKKVLRRTRKIQFSNSNLQKDGSGAQILRIASIYSIATKLGTSFHYKHIDNFEIQHGDGFLNEEEITNYLALLNELFNSFSFEKHSVEVKCNSQIGFTICAFIFKYAIKASITRKEYVLVFNDLFPLINLDLKSYKFFKDKWRTLLVDNYHNDNSFFDVSIHLRLSTISRSSDRHIPREYYLDMINLAKDISEKENKVCKFTIHTDIAPDLKGESVIENHLTMDTKKYWKTIGITNNDGRLNEETIAEALIYLEEITQECEYCIIRQGIKPIEAWREISHSDFLVASNSAFSAIGHFSLGKGMTSVPYHKDKLYNAEIIWNPGTKNYV